MDNDKKDLKDATDDENKIKIDVTAVADKELSTAQVETKKSGGGLSLFISILALAGTGYLLFKDYTASDSNLKTDDQQISSLKDQDKALVKDIQDIQLELQDLITAIKTYQAQVDQLDTQNNDDSVPGITAFDNSENEAALVELKNQLASYQLKMQQLSQKLDQLNDAEQQTTTRDVVPGIDQIGIDQFNSSVTLETLMITDLLLANNQVVQAKNALNSHLSTAIMRPSIRSKISNLIKQLNEVEMPDIEQLTEELTQLKTLISDLQIPTEKPVTEQTHWYDRFISVKKISTDSSGLANSAFLEILKSQLNNHFLQAELALVMQNQSSWHLQLQAAAKLLAQQLPEQAALAEQIQQLAEATISPVVPESLDIQGLITELKGLR